MEETRISRMYLAIVGRALGKGMEKVIGGAWLGSPSTWVVAAILLLVGVGVAVHEKGRGHLGQLKAQLGAAPAAVEVETPQPGGQAPIVLSRDQQPGALAPEFLSTTLLPGRGMNVLQIMAFVPGKGAVPLLASPSLADAAKAMTGSGEDANGQASLTNGAAIEVPWAGRMLGAPMPGGLSIVANWRGRGLTLPVNSAGGAEGGLLLRSGANSAQPSVMPDGGVVQATFAASDFDGHWPSKTEVTTTVLLSARTIDLTIVARNAGSEPEPMGVGWRPRFALAESDRAQVRLRLPSTARAEAKEGQPDIPTGRLLPVQGTSLDFSEPSGTALKANSLDELYVRLKNGMLSAGPEIELHNPAAGYGLRMTLLSTSIKAVRVAAPLHGGFIAIDPQTNYDDPFGREWAKDEDTGLVVLQPRESLQWKVRLELLPKTQTSTTEP